MGLRVVPERTIVNHCDGIQIGNPYSTMAESGTELTTLLTAAADGQRDALDELFQRVYPELKRLARQVRAGRVGETFNTTALAHEAYLKMLPGRAVDWKGKAHFLAVAARAMRQILVDAARARMAEKRGGGKAWRVSLDDEAHAAPMRAAELIALDEALEELAQMDVRRAKVVEHKYFGGLTTEEVATVLNISTATVERDWRSARAWLATKLENR